MKTQELEERIRQEALFDAELIANNAAPTFSAFLVECAERAEIKRSDIIRALNVDRNYGTSLLTARVCRHGRRCCAWRFCCGWT